MIRGRKSILRCAGRLFGRKNAISAVAENQPTKNRMYDWHIFEDYRRKLLTIIREGMVFDFKEMALSIFRLQYEALPAYRRFCNKRRVYDSLGIWELIPPMPTTAFKELPLTALPEDIITTVFESSGTTGQKPSRHFHCEDSLTAYEASCLNWFQQHVLPPLDGHRYIILTPAAEDAPHSSLVHMFDTIERVVGAATSEFVGVAKDGGWHIDHDRVIDLLVDAARFDRTVTLLGTAFSFVHLLDECKKRDKTFQLAPGSRAMETGGYKGKSRTMPKDELHKAITETLGIQPQWIVCEYGMSELSSQAYDHVAGSEEYRVFRFPPWARTRVVSAETGNEVKLGETGLLQIFDLANVYSMMAVQTEDRVKRLEDGFELVGRVNGAEPRGCSLMPSDS